MKLYLHLSIYPRPVSVFFTIRNKRWSLAEKENKAVERTCPLGAEG
jgi:hypothetical protein